MGQVSVRVNGYGHTIGCKDGEEAHVTELIGQIEAKTKLIRSMGGQFSESRMLLHVALLLADEAGDLRAEVARLVVRRPHSRRPATRRPADPHRRADRGPGRDAGHHAGGAGAGVRPGLAAEAPRPYIRGAGLPGASG